MKKLVYIFLTLIFLAGCQTTYTTTSQTYGQQKSGAENAASSAKVYIHDNYFSPDTVTISAGGTVTWENQGLMSSTVSSIASSSEEYNSGVIGRGEQWSRQYNNPGTFKYFSASNPSARGTVIVK